MRDMAVLRAAALAAPLVVFASAAAQAEGQRCIHVDVMPTLRSRSVRRDVARRCRSSRGSRTTSGTFVDTAVHHRADRLVRHRQPARPLGLQQRSDWPYGRRDHRCSRCGRTAEDAVRIARPARRSRRSRSRTARSRTSATRSTRARARRTSAGRCSRSSLVGHRRCVRVDGVHRQGRDVEHRRDVAVSAAPGLARQPGARLVVGRHVQACSTRSTRSRRRRRRMASSPT